MLLVHFHGKFKLCAERPTIKVSKRSTNMGAKPVPSPTFWSMKEFKNKLKWINKLKLTIFTIKYAWVQLIQATHLCIETSFFGLP